MVDGNKLGDAGFKYLGTPYSQMDCQAFVERCLADCGNHTDLPGSNAWYRKVMKEGWVGTPEECVANLGCVPKGAFLFILLQDGGEPDKYKPDGIGNASHIGLVTMPRGEGAIHSSASRGCVAESKFAGKTIKNGGWNRVGLWNEVSYDYSGGDIPDPGPDPDPDPDPDPEPTPEHQTAIVGNVPANKRQDVNMRAKPSKNASLVDRVPCGEEVDVLSYADDWCKIRWNKETGYMMTQYLIFEDEPVTEDYYCVTIHDLDHDTAEEIVSIYGGTIRKEGVGVG